MGSTGRAPSVALTSIFGSAAAISPVSIRGSRGKTASGSVGSAQVGGGNSAGGSVVTGQISSVNGAPDLSFGLGGAHGDSSSAASMPGGDHAANGPFLQLQAGQPSVGAQGGAGAESPAEIGLGP